MKEKPLYSRRGWKVGDLVMAVGMPSDTRDEEEFKTRTLFKLCQGETFPIVMFDRYNHVGIEIRKRKPQFRRFKNHWLFVEPHFLRRVRRTAKKKQPMLPSSTEGFSFRLPSETISAWTSPPPSC